MFKATKNSPTNLSILRSNRDKLLAATDWCLTIDAPLSLEEKETVMEYRAALRNCTKPEAGVVATLPASDALPSKALASVRAVVLD